jgi:hypothetical protein
MPALDLVSGTASLTGVSTFGALVPVAGDTFAVRNYTPGTKAYLLNAWRKGATAGMIRVRSPYLHDIQNGIRSRVLAADPTPITPYDVNQPLHAQDTLIFESTGGAAAEQESGCLLNWYENPGVVGRYITWEEANARVNALVSTEVAVTGGAVAVWGSALLSAGTGVLDANTDYAVLGYNLDVACTAIGVSGLDTANMRAGGPGLTNHFETYDFFLRLARLAQIAAVPVINAANAGGTQVWVVDSAGATAVNVNLILGRLS